MLLCDVRNRWELLKGNESYFTTGTDEHGLKIQMAAEKRGITPQEFVNQLTVVFKDLAKLSNIKYDRFIRTTDLDHISAVHHFWEILEEKGYIYKGEHGSWYSVSDETFYPETRIIKEGACYYSIETGAEVKFTSEENYFFRLSNFQNDLIKLLEKNPSFIIPKQKHQDVLNELKSCPLTDLSISRPSNRLKWGIEVPSDKSQRIYVWIDALINYLTSAGYPQLNSKWPATHLIGKDITRFHCIYWPALLMAAGVQIPQQIVVHGHWLAEGFKMSKSKGNVVEPILMANYYGIDSLRFFLCENSVLNGDGNFSEEQLWRTRNQLIDKYLNLVMRVCGKKFNIERAISKLDSFKDYKFEDSLQPQYEHLIDSINELSNKIGPKIETFNTSGIIKDFWSVIQDANQFVQTLKPWTRDEDTEDLIIFTAAEAARVASLLIQPIIPELSSMVLARLNTDKTSIKYAQYGADKTYGKGANRSGDYPIKKIDLRIA